MKTVRVLLCAAAAALALHVGVASAAGEMVLKVPLAFTTNLPGMGSTAKWMSERIGIASGGSVKMKIYEPGKLIAPGEILDAVSTGKVNAGYATAGYWTGKLPAAQLFSTVPFGPEAGEYLAWFWYGNGMRLYQQLYDQAGYNVKVLLCGIVAPESSGWFSTEIDDVEKLKGLKMRFIGLGGQVFRKLGVQTSAQSGGKIVQSLRDNTLDAAEFSMPAIDRMLGLQELAKYNFFPGWHQQAMTMELLINKETWNRMNKAQQMMVDITCRAATADSYAYTEAIQAEVMKNNVTQYGVENRYWSQAMLDTFHETWLEVAEEQAGRDPFFRKVWDDMSEFRSSYAIWKANAFLPRDAQQGLHEQ
ncbi:MAG: TRAP transporter substrate-binding protein [Gammaproteobacteria bacterium]|nr:TRAP transporter substrate-binding protein [Gammaproteobacteria bacterium]